MTESARGSLAVASGWRRIGPSPGLAAWAAAALPFARAALAQSAEALRSGGTWAVGLDLLPNEASGRIGGVDLPWEDLGLAPADLHRAQLSTIYPGYPQPSEAESASAFAFRQRRDAAHLDGFLAVEPGRQRMVKEPHGWILGLPLTETSPAPLVVWEGSHEILRRALRAELMAHPTGLWGEIDLTAAYGAARRQIFDQCPRVVLQASPGEAIWLHRLTLHGVAPWAAEDPAAAGLAESGRIIAYFRPLLGSVRDWLLRP